MAAARLILLALLLISLITPLSVHAQGADTPARTNRATDTTPQRTAPPTQRESIVDRVKANREAALERIETQKTAFKQRVAEINDENKQEALTRIGEALTNLNTNKTTKWADALDKLEGILARIQAKVDQAEALGADATSATEAIASADDALNDAKSAVEEQAENTYVIEITDEESLRTTVQPVVAELKSDLGVAHASVIEARNAVRLAAQALSTITIPTESDDINSSGLQL